jgi:exosortase E/protease (VPEID-CTERM system)
VVAILGLFEPTVLCRPAEMVVGTPTFEGIISPTCSGFEGIGMTTALLAGYLWYDRAALRFPIALLLLPLGVASIWICNCARIAALILIGSSGYPAVAQGGFHSQAGWLAFNAVGLGTIALARFRVFRRDPAAETAASESNPVVPYVVPLMALLIAMMATAALSPGSGLDRLYPARVAAVAVAFWSLRRRYAEPLWSLSWAAPAIGLVVFVVWMALEPIRGASADPALNPWRLGPAWASAWLAFRVVGSVVTVPMAEELAFRGFLLRRLVSADFESAEAGRFSWPSFLGSSLLFGAMHGRWVAGTLAGAAYALAVYRRGRLSDAVVAHATTNALIAAYVIATGNWSVWS